MAPAAEDVGQKISRKDAEMLVRGWNLLYNRTLSYSFSHPLVQDTLPKVHALFDLVLKDVGTLNILLQEAMFFVDSVDVMYQPNNRRIADHLRRFGIESITLLPGFGAGEFGILINACGLIHPDAMGFAKYLSGHGASHVEVNKVSLRAVKEGDELVPAGSPRTDGAPQAEGGGSFQDIVARAVVGRLTAQELEGNMLLASLLAQPDSLGKAVVEKIGTSATPGADKTNVEDILLGVLSQFAQSSRTAGHSLEELLTGIYSMRSEMLEVIKTQKELDTALQEDDIQVAADDAFERTVCQIAADDWQRSKGNAKRMATVLTRVVPGRKELRRLLPRLKQTFLAMGVTLQQWYSLIAEITNLFGIEKTMDQLAEVATEFGVTPDEILGELQRDPHATARLLLASAEIRRVGGGEAEDHMIQSLLDAVDQTGERLAESAEKDPRAAAGIARSFERLRSELEQELSAKELDPSLRQAAIKKLEHRSQHTLIDLKARAFTSQLENGALSGEEKAGLLEELSSGEEELDAILGTALSLVGENEVAQQIAQEIVAKVRERLRLEKEKKAGSSLPHGVYPRSVAEFFLRFELKRAQRYGFGFTCLLVSFQGLPEEPEVFKIHEQQLRGLSNTLSAELHRLLREVDFVGNFGYNRLFVVLPMTQPPNDLPVLKKLKDHLSRQVALPTGNVLVRPRIGVVSIEGGQKMSLQEVYEAASRKWQEDL
jgi:hypothetical protein